jgi:hypothetical protein
LQTYKYPYNNSYLHYLFFKLALEFDKTKSLSLASQMRQTANSSLTQNVKPKNSLQRSLHIQRTHQNGRGVVFKKQETLGTPRSSTHALVSLCAGSLNLRIIHECAFRCAPKIMTNDYFTISERAQTPLLSESYHLSDKIVTPRFFLSPFSQRVSEVLLCDTVSGFFSMPTHCGFVRGCRLPS